MQPRPIIGIATENAVAHPGNPAPSWIMEQRYVRPLAKLGAVPWLIPLLEGDEQTLELIYASLDGVFITGGVDVDPSCYREKRDARCGRTDPPRDWIETRLIQWAINDAKPILGVCRGIQIINAVAGGTLFQDVPSQIPAAIRHECPAANVGNEPDPLAHPIRVGPDSRLRQILGAGEFQVNSTHHQAVKELAPGFAASAWAADEVIEGIESKQDDAFLVAVQWHPEDMVETSPAMRQLFHSFLTAALAYRQGKMSSLATLA